MADLADRVMTLIYGPHAETALMHRLMHLDASDDLSSHQVGDDAEVVALVKSQIISALASGQIVLAADIDTTLFDKRGDNHHDHLTIMQVDKDNKSDYESEWVLAPGFWSQENAANSINWSNSVVDVSTEYLYKGYSVLELTPPFIESRPLSRYFANLPSSMPVKVLVANPDVALRRFFKFGPLPSENQAYEYQSSIAHLVKEATAAAWRYLATTGEGPDFNQRNLVRQMIRYLKSRNLYDDENDRPSQGVLLTIAGKMHKQFQQDAELVASQSVFVSSTPAAGSSAPVSKRQMGRKRRPPATKPNV